MQIHKKEEDGGRKKFESVGREDKKKEKGKRPRIAQRSSEHLATLFLATHNGGFQCGDNRLVKDVLQALLRQRRALDILDGPKLPRKPFALLGGDRTLLLPCQFLDDLSVVPQIYLRPNDQAGNPWTVMVHFREPFLFYVFKGSR